METSSLKNRKIKNREFLGINIDVTPMMELKGDASLKAVQLKFSSF
jgi:hypothetical protein